MSHPKLSIVIPVWNEGVNLKITLKILRALVDFDHEVLIVYDFDEDDSIPVVKSFQEKYQGLRLVHNTLGKGVVNAIKAGVNAAEGDYILTIAADDMGTIIGIEDMVQLMDEGCDLVNATRYAYGGKNIGGSWLSTLLSVTLNKAFYILAGSAFTDPTFGVKMFRRDKFKTLKIESKPVGWAHSLEMAVKAQLAGWQLGEAPLISLNRLYGGNSSFAAHKWASEYARWFFWGIKHLSRSDKSRKNIQVKIPEKIRFKRHK